MEKEKHLTMMLELLSHKLKRGRTPMKPIGMRNGKKGRRKKQKKKKIERWNGKYKKFKVSKHVH
jgi:hypothetical protein